jgi:hypothetical protein
VNGYFLKGSNGEHILVFRSKDEECLLLILRKLQTGRNKELKMLAERLETDWYGDI